MEVRLSNHLFDDREIGSFIMEAVRRLSPRGSPVTYGLDPRLGDRKIVDIEIHSLATSHHAITIQVRDAQILHIGIGAGGMYRWVARPGNEIYYSLGDKFDIVIKPKPVGELGIALTYDIAKAPQSRKQYFVETFKVGRHCAWTTAIAALDPTDAHLIQ